MGLFKKVGKTLKVRISRIKMMLLKPHKKVSFEFFQEDFDLIFGHTHESYKKARRKYRFLVATSEDGIRKFHIKSTENCCASICLQLGEEVAYLEELKKKMKQSKSERKKKYAEQVAVV